ncbi:MAG: patatin-like phospholipase family protein [Clostridiales bacterium]|nr:patatin-like phospholipase family protein [Clostridiales bacterium]
MLIKIGGGIMLGLTLGGGGARGSYQIGAWKAFRELGIEFQGVTGTSVGALNGALFAQNDFDEGYNIWSNMSFDSVVDIDAKILDRIKDFRSIQEDLPIIYKEVKKTIMDLGLDTQPLEKLIKRVLKEKKLRKSGKDFGLVTFSISDFKAMEVFLEDIPEGELPEYLLASAYLPIFKAKKLKGKWYLDGGVHNNLPTEMLYRKGYKKIVIIKLQKGGIRNKQYPQDLEIIEIAPNQSLGNMMDFAKERANFNLKLGYYDTLRVFKGFKGVNYYLKDNVDEAQALQFFMKLSEESIKELSRLFDLPQFMSIHRLLLEGIIPRFIKLTGLNEKSTYSEVLTKLIESMAASCKVEQLHIYTTDDLLKEVQKAYIKKDAQKTKQNVASQAYHDIIIRVDRDKMLKEALGVLLRHNSGIRI